MKLGTQQEEGACTCAWKTKYGIAGMGRSRHRQQRRLVVVGKTFESVGNTTGDVQTLPSVQSRATTYGGGGGDGEGREVDTKSEGEAR